MKDEKFVETNWEADYQSDVQLKLRVFMKDCYKEPLQFINIVNEIVCCDIFWRDAEIKKNYSSLISPHECTV